MANEDKRSKVKALRVVRGPLKEWGAMASETASAIGIIGPTGLEIARWAMVDNCIREYRVKRGWTQQQLADKVDGVNQPRIAARETGIRDFGDTSLNVAIKVANALRLSNPRRLLEAPSESRENTSES